MEQNEKDTVCKLIKTASSAKVSNLKCFKKKLDNEFPTNIIQNYFITHIPNEAIESLLNENKLVIIYGHPGIGKTTHVKQYCTYISKKDKIVRWIDAWSENEIRKSIKKIVEQIIKDTVNSDDFDTICTHLARAIKNDLNEQSIIFVFDNLENFEILKNFIAKFVGMNNIQLLVTTKDSSFKEKLSKYKFKDIRIDFFGYKQARQFFENSLDKKYSNVEKNILVKKVLKSEEDAFLPHTLNSIVNFINNTDFEIEEFLRKPICEIKHTYFSFYEKIENKNSMKILYYMSLMDPNRIPSFLIIDLFKNDIDIESLQEAIDVLIRMGFIESFKSDKLKYFSIHRLIQATSKTFRKSKNIDYEIENKLLISFNNFFTTEINFFFFTIKEKARQLVSHIYKFICVNEGLGINICRDRRERFKLLLNFAIYLLQEEESSQNIEFKGVDYKKILDDCYTEFGNVYDDFKLQICHALGSHYLKKKFNQQEALRYFKEGLSISKTLYSNHNNYLIVIGLYEVASIYFEMDFYHASLKTATEAYEMCVLTNDYNHQSLTILSLIVRIKFMLNELKNADQLLDELIKIHVHEEQKHRYEDPLKRAKHKLDIIAENSSYLGKNDIALKYALEALEIYEQNLSSDDFRFIGVLISVAKIYKQCNNDYNSKKYLDESLTLLKKCELSENSSELVFLYNHIGILLHSFRRYDEAIIYFNKYYFYMKENRCENTAIVLSYLGDCYVERNKLEDAIECYKESIDIEENIHPFGNFESPRSFLTTLEDQLKKRKN